MEINRRLRGDTGFPFPRKGGGRGRVAGVGGSGTEMEQSLTTNSAGWVGGGGLVGK